MIGVRLGVQRAGRQDTRDGDIMQECLAILLRSPAQAPSTWSPAQWQLV
jgi:hypothetical protein